MKQHGLSIMEQQEDQLLLPGNVVNANGKIVECKWIYGALRMEDTCKGEMQQMPSMHCYDPCPDYSPIVWRVDSIAVQDRTTANNKIRLHGDPGSSHLL
jgi:hypothetical protein